TASIQPTSYWLIWSLLVGLCPVVISNSQLLKSPNTGEKELTKEAYLATLDPEIKKAYEHVEFDSPEQIDKAFADILALQNKKSWNETYTRIKSKIVTKTKKKINESVTLNIYSQKSSKSRPGLYWIHPGGFFFGDTDYEDFMMQRIAEELDFVVVSVNYRLWPAKYPEIFEDCYAGLRYVWDNAEKLSINKSQLAIGGASAGGGLAACCALRARDEKNDKEDKNPIEINFQWLIQPMLDDRTNLPSTVKLGLSPGWPSEANRLAWKHYLGGNYSKEHHPYAVAFRAEDLKGLPKTFIGVGSAEIFRDENIIFAQRLLDANVVVELNVYPGVTHGVDNYRIDNPFDKVAEEVREVNLNALKRAFRQ
ncbi:unnamed protein product, partial [Didymodactylos carnosus]